MKGFPVPVLADKFAARAAKIVALSASLARDTLAASPGLWEGSVGLDAVKRAIEVAAVASTPVLFIGPNADLAALLALQAGVPAVSVVDPADPLLAAEMKACPMHVEAPSVPARRTVARGSPEPLSSVLARVGAARAASPGFASFALDDSARTLWNQACAELPIPCELTRRSILSVARSCAVLNRSGRIALADVAEAVQYWLDRR